MLAACYNTGHRRMGLTLTLEKANLDYFMS